MKKHDKISRDEGKASMFSEVEHGRWMELETERKRQKSNGQKMS